MSKSPYVVDDIKSWALCENRLNIDTSQVKSVFALACVAWYLFVISIHSLGLFQIFRHYSTRRNLGVSSTLDIKDVPHVTILRPIKGLELFLYECLVATFLQCYPREKLTIFFCVATTDDPSLPTLRRLLNEFPEYDAHILIQAEDDVLINLERSENLKLGPNPKIRNLSRGYREAKGDLIWILDCNVWVGRGVMSRMVDKLCGINADGTRNIPFKLVHQLPIVVDCSKYYLDHSTNGVIDWKPNGLSSTEINQSNQFAMANYLSIFSKIKSFGGYLEEVFMASSHAKNYVAINAVSVASCLVGKSNMFRKSHLDFLTHEKPNSPAGLDFFSNYICEDHMIGNTLWCNQVQEEKLGQKFYKHGLVYGDLAIQPISGLSIPGYFGRRVRWIRGRKWAVLMATIVEPGIESLFCSVLGAFGFTSLSWFQGLFGTSQTWSFFLVVWLTCVSIHFWVDLLCFTKLHSGASTEIDAHTPRFVHSPSLNKKFCHRSISQWIIAWIGRELLAFPIWAWACFGGTTVMWRGQKFFTKSDMSLTQVAPTEADFLKAYIKHDQKIN